jgi:hypothetical protein
MIPWQASATTVLAPAPGKMLEIPCAEFSDHCGAVQTRAAMPKMGVAPSIHAKVSRHGREAPNKAAPLQWPPPGITGTSRCEAWSLSRYSL